MADEPVSRSDRIVLSTQSLPPAPEISPSLPGSSQHHITIPFQSLIFDLNGTETKSYSTVLPTLPIIAKHIQYFRYATVSNLEAVVFPSAAALKIPVTVDLAWTTADVVPTGKDVLGTPSSARITIGGLDIVNSGVLAADLRYINPVIKSPISYSDTPRLSMHFHSNPDAVAQGLSTKIKATIFIRGDLHLSSPLLAP